MGTPSRAVLAAALLAAPHAAHPADTITARAKLNDAVAAAKRWRPDAALSSVGTSDARPDGTSTHWSYAFQSKGTRTCFRLVVLASGATTPTDLGECTLATPIAEDFVDSPAAVGGALAGGFKAGDTIAAVLVHLDDGALARPRECWKVSSREHDFDPGRAVMRGWCVDPKTGKLVARTSGERRKGR